MKSSEICDKVFVGPRSRMERHLEPWGDLGLIRGQVGASVWDRIGSLTYVPVARAVGRAEWALVVVVRGRL